MKKLYINSESGERYLITVSSTATMEDAADSITAETGGDCIGPADDCESELAYLREHWNELEPMSEEEADARIAHLADEWGLSAEELDYLK